MRILRQERRWRKEASRLAEAGEPVGRRRGRGRGRGGDGGGGGGGGGGGEEGEEEEHMQDPAGLALSQSGSNEGLQVSNQCLIRAFL